MARVQNVKIVNLPAGEDLTDDQNHTLQINTAGRVIKTDSLGDVIIGVLAEGADTATVGNFVPVALVSGGGVLKAKAGATITAGQYIVPDTTSGRIAGVTGIAGLGTNQTAAGIALEAAADGQVIEFLAFHVAGNA